MSANFISFVNLLRKITKHIHKEIGPGFTESVYQGALAIELRRYKISYLKEFTFDVIYRTQVAGTGRLDFLIKDSNFPNLIIETKSISKISNDSRSQLASYLIAASKSSEKVLSDSKYGILINWPGASINENESSSNVLENLEPELEFYKYENKKVERVEIS